MRYFDVVTKTWKPLPSIPQANAHNQSCFCAEYAGNYLYVAAKNQSDHFLIYRYDTINNSWGTMPPFLGSSHQIDCLCSGDDFIYAIRESNLQTELQRYSLTNNNWQSGGSLSFSRSGRDKSITVAAAIFKSEVYIIRGYRRNEGSYSNIRFENWISKTAVVLCFDPAKNEWEQKASTCKPHFGSSLFVVNDRLYVAGVNIGFKRTASVEVYDKENNTWSVVEQKHIPQNKLGAVEIEGRVYFIINKFPIDSGIRIPSGENCHVSLKEWENLAKVAEGAVLCYLPVKRENLEMEEGESETDEQVHMFEQVSMSYSW